MHLAHDYGINYAFFIFQLSLPFFSRQNSMYLYSSNHRIEYKIDFEDERFISMKIDPCGFFFETQSFKTPRKVYRVNFEQLVYNRNLFAPTGIIKPALWKESKIPHLDVPKLKVNHDSFQSFDQINVPMTIVQRTSGDDSCKKPCLVFAYGGYGIPILPLFKLFFLLFIELFNGVVGLCAFQSILLHFTSIRNLIELFSL